jgi:hypothetical protein
LLKWAENFNAPIINHQFFSGISALFIALAVIIGSSIYVAFLVIEISSTQIGLLPWKLDIETILENLQNIVAFSGLYGFAIILALTSFIFIPLAAFVALGAGRLISPMIARSSDRIFMSNLRSSLFGSDLRKEEIWGVSVVPDSFTTGLRTLPKDVVSQMDFASERDIAKALTQVRALFAAAIAAGASKDVMLGRASEMLTWNEFIHTSYFHSSRFVEVLFDVIADQKPTP